MSVINQMLRDLDARQKAGQSSVTSDPGARAVTRGAVSVAPQASERSTLRSRWITWVALLLVLGGVGWWLGGHPGWGGVPAGNEKQQASVSVPPAQATQQLPAQTQSAPPASAAVNPVNPIVDAAAPGSMPLAALKPAAIAPLRSASTPELRVSAGPKPLAMPGESGVKEVPTHAVTPAAPEPARVPSLTSAPVVAGAREAAADAGAKRVASGMELIRQAQNLWEQGQRDTAIASLTESVSGLERGTNTAASGDTLALAVRELARMQMAQGNVGKALDLLVKAEPLLANQPDVWALRGNAAQRLGRHSESVQAYLTALKLRPREGRWLAGAAVSMAADGHPAEAAELANQARELGSLSPEVAAFLQQQGVSLRQP